MAHDRFANRLQNTADRAVALGETDRHRSLLAEEHQSFVCPVGPRQIPQESPPPANSLVGRHVLVGQAGFLSPDLRQHRRPRLRQHTEEISQVAAHRDRFAAIEPGNQLAPGLWQLGLASESQLPVQNDTRSTPDRTSSRCMRRDPPLNVERDLEVSCQLLEQDQCGLLANLAAGLMALDDNPVRTCLCGPLCAVEIDRFDQELETFLRRELDKPSHSFLGLGLDDQSVQPVGQGLEECPIEVVEKGRDSDPALLSTVAMQIEQRLADSLWSRIQGEIEDPQGSGTAGGDGDSGMKEARWVLGDQAKIRHHTPPRPLSGHSRSKKEGTEGSQRRNNDIGNPRHDRTSGARLGPRLTVETMSCNPVLICCSPMPTSAYITTISPVVVEWSSIPPPRCPAIP